MGKRLLWVCVCLSVVLGSQNAMAQDSGYLRYEKQGAFSPNDYLLKSRDDRRDPVFDRYETVDLGINLGIGSDCGQVDFKSTLNAAYKNMLRLEYYKDWMQQIIGDSPMLIACYASPSWCSILKHSQISANFMAQMRIDQCAITEKYVDKRVDDFYAERQTCVHEKIKENGGDLEAAMDSCRNVWDVDLPSWAGGSDKTDSNKLLESSASWAGYEGQAADRSLDLLKSLVGDTVVSKGNVSVEYGTRAAPLTPQKHLQELRAGVHTKLCRDLVVRAVNRRGSEGINRTVSDRDLKDISGGAEEILVDRQTIEALAYMPALQREEACRKLSDAVAMTTMTRDMNRSLDILTVSTQNPHLPPHRKAELEEKRRTLKESIEITMELQRQRNEPLNRVVSQINSTGEKYRGEASDRVISGTAAAHDQGAVHAAFFDCADGVMCQEGR